MRNRLQQTAFRILLSLLLPLLECQKCFAYEVEAKNSPEQPIQDWKESKASDATNDYLWTGICLTGSIVCFVAASSRAKSSNRSEYGAYLGLGIGCALVGGYFFLEGRDADRRSAFGADGSFVTTLAWVPYIETGNNEVRPTLRWSATF